MKNLFKEPLVHFILLGGLLFAVYSGVTSEEEPVVKFDQYDYDRTLAEFEDRWGRKPNKDEIKAMVEGEVNRQILYELALEEGVHLFHDDVQDAMVEAWKEILTQGLASPSRDELATFYKKNIERYRKPPVFTVYVASDTIGWTSEGYNKRFDSLTLFQLRDHFDMQFLSRIDEFSPDKWYGLYSLKDDNRRGFYVKLIKHDGQYLPFEGVEEEVLVEWEKAQTQMLIDSVVQEYRADYTLEMMFSDVDSLTL